MGNAGSGAHAEQPPVTRAQLSWDHTHAPDVTCSGGKRRPRVTRTNVGIRSEPCALAGVKVKRCSC